MLRGMGADSMSGWVWAVPAMWLTASLVILATLAWAAPQWERRARWDAWAAGSEPGGPDDRPRGDRRHLPPPPTPRV